MTDILHNARILIIDVGYMRDGITVTGSTEKCSLISRGLSVLI